MRDWNFMGTSIPKMESLCDILNVFCLGERYMTHISFSLWRNDTSSRQDNLEDKKNGKQMNKGALTNHCQIQWPLRSFHIHPRYICSCDEKGCIYASIPIPSFPGCKPVAMAFIYEGIPDPSPKMFLKKHLYTYRDPRIPFKKHVMLSCHVRCVYVQNPSDPKNRMNMSNKSWWWRASQHPWVGGDRSIRPKTRACAAFTNQMDLGNGGEIHYTSPAV